MKRGDAIKGPACIRRRYKGEWEYALLHANGTFSPFGNTAPSRVKWVYQVTWKDTLQRIHTLSGDDNHWPKPYGVDPEEKDCWWTKPAPWIPELEGTLAAHGGEAPRMEAA